MHGEVNLSAFAPGREEESIGENVSLIHEVSPLRFSSTRFVPDVIFLVGHSRWKDARHRCCSLLLTYGLDLSFYIHTCLSWPIVALCCILSQIRLPHRKVLLFDNRACFFKSPGSCYIYSMCLSNEMD